MYNTIYVPLDNSDHSNTAMELSIQLGKSYESKLVGSHVYAAKLHDVRFKQMEFTLPEEYKEETELEKQRRIHDALITRGLELISDSYLIVMKTPCDEAGLEFEGKMFDGRNFEALVTDINGSDYDLVIMGALGQGAVKQSGAGSVCERVLRRTAVDTLVIRDIEANVIQGDGAIVVALDGSRWSWGGVQAALSLAQKTQRSLELVVVHGSNGVAEELLDAHLALARRIARKADVKVSTTSLDGWAPAAVAEYVEKNGAWLIVVGRHGLDADIESPQLGSSVEYLVRQAACNVLVVAREGYAEGAQVSEAAILPV
jgi:nucleotide-binding universal stress UspA family protein